MKREEVSSSPEITPGPTSTNLIADDHVWYELENFIKTDEGGYRNIYGVRPLLPTAAGAIPNGGAYTPSPTTPTYGVPTGIFHAKLKGGARDVTLVYMTAVDSLDIKPQLWEFTGWNRQWRVLAGESSTTPQYAVEFSQPQTTDFPIQFCATPTGIIIIPPGSRALFYDGEVILPLGYSERPSAPIGLGPENSSGRFGFSFPNDPFFGVNDAGYTMDALDDHPPSKMFPVWKGGRIGTIDTPGNISTLASTPADSSQVMGYLQPGRWRCKTRYIDRWGNLSPWSGESNDVQVSRQPAMRITGAAGSYSSAWIHADKARKQFAWDGIALGPDGTIGRELARTKDLVNSGDPEFYSLPRNSSSTSNAFATLTDNLSTCYPDNIPDAWLFAKVDDVLPFPTVSLVEMAFGRAFYANAIGDEGAVFWSEVGRWGTILTRNKLYPDPSGAEVTCLRRIPDGLLAFTENGIFLISPNDSGDGLRSSPLSTTAGTTSPNTVRMLPNGMLTWLGSNGIFYGKTGSDVVQLWNDQRRLPKRIQRALLRKAVAAVDHATGEYRCWVSMMEESPYVSSFERGYANTRCFVFDGAVWRHRVDVTAADVCVTDDHRKLMLVAGAGFLVSEDEYRFGVWVLDRDGDVQAATATTTWLRSTESRERRSVFTVYLHLRETGSPTSANRIKVQVRKDFRAEIVDTKYMDESYPSLDTAFNAASVNPTLWDGDDSWGSATAKWRRRRPFWAKVSISGISSAEAFQLIFTFPDKTELLGYAFDEKPRVVQGAMSPQNSRTS